MCGSRPALRLPSREHEGVWYPFKFRGELSYTTVGGLLGQELGYASRPTWKRRRRWRLARRNDSDVLVAAVDRDHRSVVEAWSDTPDHRLASVVLRSEIGNDVSVWTETRIQPGGFQLVRLEPGQTSTELQCRSGRMIGWSALMEGQVVNVLHPEGLPTVDMNLALVPLHSIHE